MMKWGLRLLVLILAGAVLPAWAIQAGLDAWGGRGDPEAAEFLPSIYLVPEGARERGDLLLAPEPMARAGMAVLTPAEAPVAAALRPEIAVIYLHPGVVARVDPHWLRQRYCAGTVIVALNTAPSALGSRLGVPPEIADPPLEQLPAGPLGLGLSEVAIRTPSRGDLQNQHDQPVIFHCVGDAPLAHADAIQVVIPLEFLAA